MFDDFENRRDGAGRKRALASGAVSLVVYAAIGVVGAYAFQKPEKKAESDEIDVAFAETVETKVEPPPPPPPPPPPKPEEVKKPTPRVARLASPTAIPDERPEEAEPTAEPPPPVEEPEEEEAPPPPPPPDIKPDLPPPAPPPAPKPRPKRAEPINLPETAVPAQPAADNVAPVYPADKKAAGVEGLVVLKLVITETGSVADVQVLKGEEPFVSAAVAAVKSWRYTPAQVEGQTVASFKVVKIPFRLTR
jgi:protein TonB